MNYKFKNVLIAIKYADELSLRVAKEIQSYLATLSVKAEILSNQVKGTSLPDKIKDKDLIVVAGGDGTILSVARKLGFPKIPFVGINLGRVGFMTEIELEEWQEGLLAVLRGEYVLSTRLGFEYELVERREKGWALNDLVLHRSGLARLLEIEVGFAGNFFRVRADGVIFSTPTGATAYNISAGGPVLHPDIPAFSLTWICPFLNKAYPLVLPAQSELEVRIVSSEALAMLTVDGQRGIEFSSEDTLRVRSKEGLFALLQKSKESYLGKLKEKGFYL